MEEPIINEHDPVAMPETGPAPEEERSGLEALEAERDEYREGWQRAKADLVNHKRLEAERVTRALASGMRGIAEDLLLVLDSYAIALTTLEAGSPGEQGMRMIRSQLLDVLKRYGIEPIPDADLVGQPFDPALAEAIGFQEASDHSPGSVHAVVQSGYRMNGDILRPARVYLVKEAQ